MPCYQNLFWLLSFEQQVRRILIARGPLSTAESLRLLVLDSKGLSGESSDDKGCLHCSYTVILQKLDRIPEHRACF